MIAEEIERLRAQIAGLEEQLHALRVEADASDWCERQIRELLDVTEERGMPAECWVIAKEIIGIYDGREAGAES